MVYFTDSLGEFCGDLKTFLSYLLNLGDVVDIRVSLFVSLGLLQVSKTFWALVKP